MRRAEDHVWRERLMQTHGAGTPGGCVQGIIALLLTWLCIMVVVASLLRMVEVLRG